MDTGTHHHTEDAASSSSGGDGGLVLSTSDRHGGDGSAQKARACSNCARLKTKCQWPSSSRGPGSVSSASSSRHPQASCTRCSRMGLVCHVPVPQTPRRRGKSTRVAQLESKIDSLVSLFAAGQQQEQQNSIPANQETPQSHPQQRGMHCPHLPAIITNVADRSSPAKLNSHAEPTPPRPPTAQHFSTPPTSVQAAESGSLPAGHGPIAYELVPGFGLTHAEAGIYLDTFRRDYTLSLPFVILDSRKTYAELFAEEPVLFWAAIVTAAPYSWHLQVSIKEKIKHDIVDQVVVHLQRRLSLLQATLIYISWSEYHFFHEANATALMQVAYSLVIDLRLEKPTKPIQPPPRDATLKDAFNSIGPPLNTTKADLSLDEIRCLLGHYYMASLVALLFRRGAAPMWTSHHTQCCEKLLRTSRNHGDRCIVALVDLHRIVDRAVTYLSTFGAGDTTFTATLDMALNNVRREVDDLMARQDEAVKTNTMVRLTYCTLLLRLYEPIMAMQPGSLARPDGHPAGSLPRTEYLWKTVHLVKQAFDCNVSTPAAEIAYVTNNFWSLNSFNTVVAARLMTMEASSDWDPNVARQSFDFPTAMRRSSEKFTAADELMQQNGWKRPRMKTGHVLISKLSLWAEWISNWYYAIIAEQQGPISTTQDQGASGADAFQATPAASSDDTAFEMVWQELMTAPDTLSWETFLQS